MRFARTAAGAAAFAAPFILATAPTGRCRGHGRALPRRLQEARVQLARPTEELRSGLGRIPTAEELSGLMILPEDEVWEARLAANGYDSASLDAAISASEDESVLQDFSAPRTRLWSWWRTSPPWPL